MGHKRLIRYLVAKVGCQLGRCLVLIQNFSSLSGLHLEHSAQPCSSTEILVRLIVSDVQRHIVRCVHVLNAEETFYILKEPERIERREEVVISKN